MMVRDQRAAFNSARRYVERDSRDLVHLTGKMSVCRIHNNGYYRAFAENMLVRVDGCGILWGIIIN